jgi:hypothetical protein
VASVVLAYGLHDRGHRDGRTGSVCVATGNLSEAAGTHERDG